MAARSSAGVRAPSTIRSIKSSSNGLFDIKFCHGRVPRIRPPWSASSARSRLAGAMQPGLDGRDGGAEPLGQLACSVAFGIFEDQQLGVARRQPPQRGLHELLAFVINNQASGEGDASTSLAALRIA